MFGKISWLAFLSGLVFSLVATSPAQAGKGVVIGDLYSALYAESGNWWDISRPGEGLVLERQKNTVVMTLFTYSASGEPEFYLASAPLSAGLIMADPPPSRGAAQYIFTASGELYRFKNGPVLNSARRYLASDPPANEHERVGTIEAEIVPMSDALRVKISLDEDKVPAGSQQSSYRTYHKSAFGYAGFGRYVDDENAPLQAFRPCWIDLRGRWVFVDETSEDARNAWSFTFTELETSPEIQDMTCRLRKDSPIILAEHTLTYRDAKTGATLRCKTKPVHPLDDANYHPEDHRCVLRTREDEVLLWFSPKDIGVKQIIAAPGAPPAGGEGHMFWRGESVTERIIGLRLD